MQSKYTIGENTTTDPYHVRVVQIPLTRNLGNKYNEVYDEILQAVEDLIPANTKGKFTRVLYRSENLILSLDWLPVTLRSTVLQLVSRTSNKLFVGHPLCKNVFLCFHIG